MSDNKQGCQLCGELARKIDKPVQVEKDGRWIWVCPFCAETRWDLEA